VDGGPDGAVITYRLAAASQDSARVSIVNAAGDTVSRLRGPARAGLNRISWNLLVSPDGQAVAFGRGGRGQAAGPVTVPGFPPGFNPRPAESRDAPDTSASPTAQARAIAAGRGGRGGRGGGGRGGGRGGARPAETSDYRVVLEVVGQRQAQTLRVVQVEPGQVSVMTGR
jgi:hypothetical protein